MPKKSNKYILGPTKENNVLSMRSKPGATIKPANLFVGSKPKDVRSVVGNLLDPSGRMLEIKSVVSVSGKGVMQDIPKKNPWSDVLRATERKFRFLKTKAIKPIWR